MAMTNQDRTTKTQEISKALGRNTLTDEQMQYIYEDWNEFHNNTYKYVGSVVIDMVNQYLNELDAQISDEFVDREYTELECICDTCDGCIWWVNGECKIEIEEEDQA